MDVGRGGNFDIVTEVEFEAHRARDRARRRDARLPARAAREVLASARELIDAAPAELTGFSVLINGVAQVGSGEPITADGPSKFTALQATQHVNYYAHGCEPDHGVP